MNISLSIIKICILVLLISSTGLAQFDFEGCAPAQPSEFSVQELVNRTGANNALAQDEEISEPIQFDLEAVWNGKELSHVNVYFIERLGRVKFYDGNSNQVSLVGEIMVWGQVDNALMGMALHPDFKNNRWMYLWYAPDLLWGQNRVSRLARFTVNESNQLDMASEKILMENLMNKSDSFHSGGPMTFDAYGDLWITVGNNSRDHDATNFSHLSRTDSTSSDEWGTSNTASRRGSILRIHPDSSELGWRLPTGGGPNFGEYWASVFESRGNAALAAEYRDPQLVLPEIYTKGHRSNFSISVHPTKRWLTWGEVNYKDSLDEFYIVKEPIYGGYPYFHGDNERTAGHTEVLGSLQDPLKPLNTSPFNSGVTQLPPAIPGNFTNLANIAMSGPIYVYDRNLNSDIKFPPHFDHTWMTFSFGGRMHFHHLHAQDMSILKTTQVNNGFFSFIDIRRPVSGKYGPDGALYMNMYDGNYNQADNPAIIKVSYNGTCQLEPIAVMGPKEKPGVHIESRGKVRISGNLSYRLLLHNIRGKVLYESGIKREEYFSLIRLQSQWNLSHGLYFFQVKFVGYEGSSSNTLHKIFIE